MLFRKVWPQWDVHGQSPAYPILVVRALLLELLVNVREVVDEEVEVDGACLSEEVGAQDGGEQRHKPELCHTQVP